MISVTPWYWHTIVYLISLYQTLFKAAPFRMVWFYWKETNSSYWLFVQFEIIQRCRQHRQCQRNRQCWRQHLGTVEMTFSRREGGRSSFVWTAPLKNFNNWNTKSRLAFVTYGGEVKRWLFYSWPHFLWALCKQIISQKNNLIHVNILQYRCCLQAGQEIDYQSPEGNHNFSQGLDLGFEI